MKRLFILVLTLILLGCTAIAEDVQIPVFIDGVRVAFFDADGNFLMQKKADELVYVPLQSFCESLGMNAEVQGQSVSVDGMRIGMFDASGNFLSPKQFNEVDYVPLLPFCEAIALNASEDEGKIFITRENTAQTVSEDIKESTGKIALHPYNFEDYFSYDIQEQNFKATQTRINMNGGFLYMNEAEVDYVLTCNTRSTFEIENVSFSISGTVWEAHKTTSGISGVSFSEDMPANGSLTKTIHKSGSAFFDIGLKATEASLQDVSLYKASGCIIVDAKKAEEANLASYQKGTDYLKAGKYNEAKIIFSALSGIEYSDAKEMYDEVIQTEKKAYDLAIEKAAQEKENTYQNAVALELAGNYEEAIPLFDSLAGYKDSTTRITACKDGIIERDYQNAVFMMESGEYEQAILAFKTLNNYRDSNEKIETCETAILERDYNNALLLLDQCRFDEAYSSLRELGDYKDVQKLLATHDNLIEYTIMDIDAAFAVDQTVTFGSYAKQPIKWHVIARNGQDALLVAEKTLFSAPYHNYNFTESPTDVYWEISSLREYLNSVILQSCFAPDEASVIQTYSHANNDGKWTINGKTRTAKGGNNTDDKVFILSREEWATTDWRPECIGNSQKQTHLWTRDVLYRNEQKTTKNKKYYEHYAATINSNSEIVACSMNLERGIVPAIWIDVYSYKGITDKTAQSSPHSGKTTTTNGNTPTQYEMLKPGSKGQAVLDARMKLYELGYFNKKPTQKEYTSNMKDYVRKFEKDNGLKQDGILSPEDQEVLFSL